MVGQLYGLRSLDHEACKLEPFENPSASVMVPRTIFGRRKHFEDMKENGAPERMKLGTPMSLYPLYEFSCYGKSDESRYIGLDDRPY